MNSPSSRPSNNDIDVAVQNLGDEAGFLCERALRPAYVNGQVLPFGPAALLERFAKGAKHRREWRHRPDHGYAPNPTSLLRVRRERPRRRAAKKRDEFAVFGTAGDLPRCGISVCPMSVAGHSRRIDTCPTVACPLHLQERPNVGTAAK